MKHPDESNERVAEHALFEAPSASQEDYLRTQFAAVETLIRRSDRQVAQHDILIATCFELLHEAPLTTARLHAEAQAAWPGMRVTALQVETVMAAMAEANNVELVGEAGATARWRLLPGGAQDVSDSEVRSNEIVVRFKSQLADEIRTLTDANVAPEIESVSAVVIKLVRSIVADCFRITEGAAVEAVGGWMRVRNVDLDVLRAQVEAAVDDERVELVLSLTRAALDQSSDLGSELVHHLVAGHVLYLFMTRPDEIRAGEQAGSLDSEMLIVDTPTLVALVGGGAKRQAVLQLVGEAVKSGMRVVLTEGTIAEFEQHLDTTGRYAAPSFDDALAKGADPTLLRKLGGGSDTVDSWLSWAVSRPLKGRAWGHFREFIDGTGSPVLALTALGVERADDSDFAPKDVAASAFYQALRDGLVVELTENDAGRGEPQIDHDARLMHGALQQRRSNPPSEQKVWPGAFILTTDTRMDNPFELVAGASPFAVTLSVSQLALLVSAYTAPADAEKIALGATDALLDSNLIKKASLVPPEAVTYMAMALAEETVTSAESEQLSLQLRSAFEERKDDFEASSDAYKARLGELVDYRRERRARLREDGLLKQQAETLRTSAAADREASARQAAEREAQLLRDQLDDKERLLEREKSDRAADQQSSRRRRIRDALTAFGLAVAALLVFMVGAWIAAAVVLISTLFGAAHADSWIRGQSGAGAVVAATIAAVAGVVGLIWR